MAKFKLSQRHGFNIIELAVVIGVIAILAAVAVVSYRNYSIRSKFASVVPTMERLMNDSIEFSQKFGRFATAYDLGLSSTPGSGVADSPASVNEFITSLTMNDSSTGTACGSRGYVTAHLDRDLVGFSSDIVGTIPGNLGMTCYFWHYADAINKKCYYYYGTESTSQTGNIISAWFNVNTGSNWDFANRNTYIYNQTSYINSTCQ